LAAKLTLKINLGPERKKLRNPNLNVKEVLCLRASEGMDEREREREREKRRVERFCVQRTFLHQAIDAVQT